jgi:hypothetical protein
MRCRNIRRLYDRDRKVYLTPIKGIYDVPALIRMATMPRRACDAGAAKCPHKQEAWMIYTVFDALILPLTPDHCVRSFRPTCVPGERCALHSMGVRLLWRTMSKDSRPPFTCAGGLDRLAQSPASLVASS